MNMSEFEYIVYVPFLAWIAKEIYAMRISVTRFEAQIARALNIIGNHEKRLKTLEENKNELD